MQSSIQLVSKCLRNYFVVNATASRSEYWSFYIWRILIIIISSIAFFFIENSYRLHKITEHNHNIAFLIIAIIALVLTIIPMYTVTIRRLNDIHKSGTIYHIFLLTLCLSFGATAFKTIIIGTGILLGCFLFLPVSEAMEEDTKKVDRLLAQRRITRKEADKQKAINFLFVIIVTFSPIIGSIYLTKYIHPKSANFNLLTIICSMCTIILWIYNDICLASNAENTTNINETFSYSLKKTFSNIFTFNKVSSILDFWYYFSFISLSIIDSFFIKLIYYYGICKRLPYIRASDKTIINFFTINSYYWKSVEILLVLILIPLIPLTIRVLKGIHKSEFLALLLFIPIIGWGILFYLFSPYYNKNSKINFNP